MALLFYYYSRAHLQAFKPLLEETPIRLTLCGGVILCFSRDLRVHWGDAAPSAGGFAASGASVSTHVSVNIVFRLLQRYVFFF